MAFGARFVIGPPDDRQGERAIGSSRQLHAQGDDDPVDTEAEVLVFFGGGDGIEVEPAEGDLCSAFVAEGVIDDDEDPSGREEFGDEGEQEDFGDIVPVPFGGREEGVGSIPVMGGGSSGGLPEFGDGAGTGRDDPGGEELAEGVEGFGPCEDGSQGLDQNGERGDKLIPGTGFLSTGKQ